MDIMDVPVRQILDEAAAVGITRIVQVGTDVLSSRWSAEQAETYDAVLATVAIHPNEAGRGGASPEALTAIEELASRERVRGIGETGLDRYRTGPEGYAVQEASFRAHIDIAKRHGKALVIHDRDAHADVLRVLDEEGAPERTVFHCFSGDAEMARRCADRGYVMSFAGTVTFKNAEALREAARVAPLDLLLVETDAPFLTPMPFRGRPNAPYLIPHTLRVVAQIKSVDLDDLCTAVTATGRRMFD
ncbi:MAG: TatD family hydrolase [Geodermatophilaceae bacterium]|nr:TatD family hydrolase [Geodermatophilaceae bacterium]